MSVKSRRRTAIGATVLASLGLGGVGAAGALIGDTPRIAAMTLTAEVDSSGSALVSEVIDYDFGIASKHGIYRDVPGLMPDAFVEVTSDSAPDQFTMISLGSEVRIRIGDPNRTITGAHRYSIEYPLDTLQQGNIISWNAVGTEWAVPIRNVEIELLAPYILSDVRCDVGKWASVGGCTAEQIEPGRIVASVDSLDTGEGITITATTGPASPLPAASLVPGEDTSTTGRGIGLLAGAALLASAVVALPMTFVYRRLGRERVWEGGAADAAYGRTSDSMGERRVDYSELQDLTTIEFVPPDDLDPYEGGIVLAEKAKPEHKVAWLLQASIDGEIDISDDSSPVITDTGIKHPILRTMMGQRKSLTMGKYDSAFGKGWKQLDRHLAEWKTASELWDPKGDGSRVSALVVGWLAIVAGAMALFFGAGFAVRGVGFGLPMAIVGAVVAGLGASAVLNAWELRVRTPEGTSRWLRVESFRRFIADSEARHVEDAARMGRLREYTAWAVALDEVDHWNKSLSAANLDDPSVAASGRMIVVAGNLGRSTSSTVNQPSSSGSGGGGFSGGGVGGGGGGGGGGSW